MATTFGKSLFLGASGSGFLYPESIGRIDKTQEGVRQEQRGVYTFNFGDNGNSDGVTYMASGDVLLCPLMDYEITSDMSIFFKETSVNAITDTSLELGWYAQNDDSIISRDWVTQDSDGITSVDVNPNSASWTSPRMIDFDAFGVDGTSSVLHGTHTAIGLRVSQAQAGGTVKLLVKIVPFRA
tara:strand:+ start:942 stop:1490 length:549 start_codon:yes stop_codon:yes gene_type:complete